MGERSYWRYLLGVLGAAGLALGGAFGSIFAVDPYGLHGSPRVEGFNARKPRIYTHARDAKLSAMRRAMPRTVLIGNSRIDVGFNPEDGVWATSERPVFNLGLPGAGLFSALEAFRESYDTGTVERVYVGIDFMDFLSRRDPGRVSVDTARVTKASRLAGVAAIERNLSLRALEDSIVTVAMQGRANVADMTVDGFNPLRQYLRLIRVEGQYALFRQKNIEYAARLRRSAYVGARSGAGGAGVLGELDDLVRFLRATGLRADLFTFSYHADLLETIDREGLWPAFEDWKRDVVDVVEDACGADCASLGLWDFASYHEPATEEPPPPRDRRTALRWFWESGHFRAELGAMMISRMHGDPSAESIGRRLTRDTIEAVLDEIRDDRRRYRQTRPAEIRRLDEMLGS